MKIEQNENQVIRSAAFEERKFTIKSNSHAFEILSSRIYTDPILAVVRELSTNAYDAHVEAFKESKPFDVHLPHHSESWFSIRDYGTGLSKTDLETIYTTYFESTRSECDDYVGCLGLGSKSPFAYTDQFSVTSYFNGKRYIYSAFKNEDGEPAIALLDECDTTEPNGLEIKLSAKSEHFTSFNLAAKRVYRFFKTKPNTNIDCSIVPKTPNIAGTGYDFYTHNKYDMDLNDSICVVMGQICYGINTTKFASALSSNATLVLRANIGELSISASREELHYDKRTLQKVQQLITDAENDIYADVDAQIKTENNLLDQARITNLYEEFLLHKVSGKITWADVAMTLEEVALVGRNQDRISIQHRHSIFPKYRTTYLFIDKNEELNNTWRRRLKSYVMSHNYIANKHYEIYLVDIKDSQKFQELFGPPAIELNKLPLPTHATKTRTASIGLSSIRKLNDSIYSNISSYWQAITTLETESVCKVRRNGSHIIWGGHEINPETAVKVAEALGIQHVYGVTENKYDKFDMPDLETTVGSRIQEELKALTPHNISYIKWDHGGLYRRNSGWEAEINIESSDFKKACEKPQNYDLLNVLYPHLNDYVKDGFDYYEVFFKRYPLLKHVGTTYNIDDINQYIAMIDKQ